MLRVGGLRPPLGVLLGDGGPATTSTFRQAPPTRTRSQPSRRTYLGGAWVPSGGPFCTVP